MTNMKTYFPSIDEDKLERMQNIRERYDAGEISLEEAQREMKEKVVSITPEEYAFAEQKYVPEATDQCMREDIKTVFEVFGDVLKITRPSLPAGHPVDTYYREDEALRAVIGEMKELRKGRFIKNQWLELMDKLAKIKIHYSRKQNQLYSALERKGFKHPSTTMWTYDDHNRDLINAARALLDDDRYDDFLDSLPTIFEDVLDLISKEEMILLPVSLRMISEEEFRVMRLGDDEIGYCLIDPPTGFLPPKPESTPSAAPEGFAAELQALINKYTPQQSAASGEILDVATGKLTLEQINLIYRHMPVDLSFVDENELVAFYTDTKHRVFPRSAGVIGREVRNCHPPKSVHIVEEIIEKFRTGEKDFVEFWINKPEVFIYITYTAVRDADGKFRGVLEMMQDCTHIRSLTGSRTLLTWEGENKSEEESSDEAKEETPAEAAPTTEDIGIDENTSLKTLLDKHPNLKQDLSQINSNIGIMMSLPFANKIIGKATIKDMASKLDIKVDELITKIGKLIKS